MIVLSTLVTAVFLSPILFALLVACGVGLTAAGRRKAAVWLLSATLLLLLALSTGPVCNLVLRPLEYRYPPFPSNSLPIDAVVVLGGGVLDGVPDEGGGASLPLDSFKRVVYGYTLSRRLGVPVIVSGGRVWKAGSEVSEADAAAALLEKLGMPPEMVIREGRSRNTWENARGVARILAERAKITPRTVCAMVRIALVTSAYHMPRAMLAFTRAGLACVPAPTDYKSQSGRRALGDALPSFDSLSSVFKAFREYMGIVQYAARR